MSDTATAPPAQPASIEPPSTPVVSPTSLGAEMISIITLATAILALGAATLMYYHDGSSAPLIGAIGLLLGKAGTVVDFWLGSSRGSQAKDGTIADQLPPVPAQAVLLPAPPALGR
jgi:hypothetical protein